MHIYRFDGYSSYTSHTGLSAEEERAIEASQNPLPELIILPNGERLDWRWEYYQCENITKSDYHIISNGIRIKLELNASPDYFKYRGCGDCRSKLIVRSPFPLTFKHHDS